MTLPEVDPPLRLTPGLEWDDTADVVIVGLGGAGACAAIEAADRGADVIAVDRFVGGGDTAMSGGVVYAGGGSKAQRAAGFDDSADNMFDYLRQEMGGAVSEPTLRRFCAGSLDELSWLQRHGVEFGTRFWPDKTAFPPNGYHLYFSGSERTGPFDRTAQPAPRGHKTNTDGMSSGAAFYRALEASARRKGVRVRTQIRAVRLIIDDDRVIGVECAVFDGALARRLHAALARLARRTTAYVSVGPVFPTYFWALRRLERLAQRRRIRLRARRGVVITTGGYSWNRDLVAAHAPYARGTMPIGFDANGSGILLGRSVGADTGFLDNVGVFRMFVPPLAFGRGMLVDGAGHRSANELWYTARVGAAMRARTCGRGYLVLDHRLVSEARAELPGLPPFSGLPARIWLAQAVKAGSLAELARKLNMPVDALQASADQVAAVAAGAPDPFDRAASDSSPLRSPPFYALDLSLAARPLPATMHTLGGLRVHERTGGVLRPDGSPIPGLFAAGRAAVGLCSHSYVSGTSLADCVFSGRRAGTCAAGSTW